MNGKQKCPYCQQWLEKYCNECYCGWKSPNSNQTFEADHQCVYASSGQRCPLDGSNNFSTHGGGPWYCLGHLRNLHDKKLCDEILIDALKNFESIMEEKIDWRIKLIPEEYCARKQRISRLFQSLKINGGRDESFKK